MNEQFDFYVRVIDKDPDGYYLPRWDQATPLVVRATNRAEAFEKARTVMGACRNGWTWTWRIDRIEAAPTGGEAT